MEMELSNTILDPKHAACGDKKVILQAKCNKLRLLNEGRHWRDFEKALREPRGLAKLLDRKSTAGVVRAVVDFLLFSEDGRSLLRTSEPHVRTKKVKELWKGCRSDQLRGILSIYAAGGWEAAVSVAHAAAGYVEGNATEKLANNAPTPAPTCLDKHWQITREFCQGRDGQPPGVLDGFMREFDVKKLQLAWELAEGTARLRDHLRKIVTNHSTPAERKRQGMQLLGRWEAEAELFVYGIESTQHEGRHYVVCSQATAARKMQEMHQNKRPLLWHEQTHLDLPIKIWFDVEHVSEFEIDMETRERMDVQYWVMRTGVEHLCRWTNAIYWEEKVTFSSNLVTAGWGNHRRRQP